MIKITQTEATHTKDVNEIHQYYKSSHDYLTPADTSFVNSIITEFLKRGKISPTQNILEIGSGYGRFSLPIIKRNYQVTASDVVPGMLAKLQKAIADENRNASAVYFDIYKTKLDKKYSIICGFHVLHHITDLPAAFQNIHDHLHKEGKIIFIEPNPINPLYYLQMLVIKEINWQGEKGILNMRNAYMKKVLQKSGFKNIEISKFGFFPNFIVNTALGNKLEAVFNKTKNNPLALYKCIQATKDT